MSEHRDMARLARRRRKHPAFPARLPPPPFEDRRKLPGDWQFKRRTGLGMRNMQDLARRVHPLPAQRQNLAPPHPRVHRDPKDAADRRVFHRRLNASAPVRQRFRRRRDHPPNDRVEPPTRRQPQIDRVAQPLVIDTGSRYPSSDGARRRRRFRRRRVDSRAGVRVRTGHRHRNAAVRRYHTVHELMVGIDFERAQAD